MIPSIIADECKGFFPQPQQWQHIDWLSLSIPSTHVPLLHEFLNRLINKLGLGWQRGRGAAFFVESLCLPHKGIRILFSDSNAPTNRGCASVQFSGKFFAFISEAKLQSLLFFFKNLKCEVRCTRIDIASNHFVKEDLLGGLVRGLRSGAYSLAGCTDWQEIYGKRKSKCLGQTLYLGSRKADTFTRVYDALPVHGDGFVLPVGWHWIRHEVENKRNMALMIFEELLRDLPFYPTEQPRITESLKFTLRSYLCRHAVQVLDSGDRASRRCSSYEWKRLTPEDWNFRYKLNRAESPLSSTINWCISGGPARFLLALQEEFGLDAIPSILQEWKIRMIEKGKDFEAEIAKVRHRFDGGALVIRPPDCQPCFISAF